MEDFRVALARCAAAMGFFFCVLVGWASSQGGAASEEPPDSCGSVTAAGSRFSVVEAMSCADVFSADKSSLTPIAAFSGLFVFVAASAETCAGSSDAGLPSASSGVLEAAASLCAGEVPAAPDL